MSVDGDKNSVDNISLDTSVLVQLGKMAVDSDHAQAKVLMRKLARSLRGSHPLVADEIVTIGRCAHRGFGVQGIGIRRIVGWDAAARQRTYARGAPPRVPPGATERSREASTNRPVGLAAARRCTCVRARAAASHPTPCVFFASPARG